MLVCSGPLAHRHPAQHTGGSLRPPAAPLSNSRTRKQRCTVLRVASRYAAGGSGGSSGAPPPQSQPPQPPLQQQYWPQQQAAAQPRPPQQQYRPPQPAQQPAPQPYPQQQWQPPPPLQQQRQPLPASRRVGPQPQQAPAFPQQPLPPAQLQQQQQLGGTLQRAASSAVAAVAPAQRDLSTTAVQPLAGMQPPAEVALPRSQLVDKEVITRTSAKRLGYISQLFVDPGSLSVVSAYLRKSANALTTPGESTAVQDRVMMESLLQISDVVLVHDETALEQFPLDDSQGYCRLVGAEVVTEDGQTLGRVRDYLFNPDTGAISTIKYDRLGQPILPQSLFSCYSISWEDVKALGPTRLVVYRGTEARAIKENDGIVEDSISWLADLLLGSAEKPSSAGAELDGGASSAALAAMGDEALRTDPAYREWYALYGEDFALRNPDQDIKPPAGWVPRGAPQQAPQQQWQPPPRAALPPPQAQTFSQVLQPQQQSQQPAFQQQMFQRQRQAVPAGSGGSGWGSPPPAQQQYAEPPPPQQQYAAPTPPQQQYASPPPPLPQQGAGMQYQQPAPQQQQPGVPRRQPLPPAGLQQPAPQQQQFRQPQPPAAAAAPAGAPPRMQQGPQQPQQPLPPQNGIPIIDRTPLPPYRRRDADGNYGIPPAQPAQQQQAQQQPPPGFAGQRAVPAAAAARPADFVGAASAPRQQQTQQPRGPPVVEPDAVIPGGGAGGSGGVTQVAEYRLL